MRSIIRRYEDDRKREKEQEFALQRIRTEAAGKPRTVPKMRELTSGRDAAGAAHMSAMEQLALSGRQAMGLEGLRQSGETTRARMRQSTTGGMSGGMSGGMPGRKLVDVPMYNESGSMVIGTTPGLVDMETGEYTELSKKKKKKKPLHEMTLEELYQERKAFGR